MNVSTPLRLTGALVTYGIVAHAIYSAASDGEQRIYCVIAVVAAFLGRRITNTMLDCEAIGHRVHMLNRKSDDSEEVDKMMKASSSELGIELAASICLCGYAIFEYFR